MRRFFVEPKIQIRRKSLDPYIYIRIEHGSKGKGNDGETNVVVLSPSLVSSSFSVRARSLEDERVGGRTKLNSFAETIILGVEASPRNRPRLADYPVGTCFSMSERPKKRKRVSLVEERETGMKFEA